MIARSYIPDVEFIFIYLKLNEAKDKVRRKEKLKELENTDVKTVYVVGIIWLCSFVYKCDANPSPLVTHNMLMLRHIDHPAHLSRLDLLHQ